MGIVGSVLKSVSPVGKVLGIGAKILGIGGRRRKLIRRRARTTGLVLGLGAGKLLFDKKDKNYNTEFNEKYANFMKYSQDNGVSGQYYKKLSLNPKYSSELDYTEKVKNSLDIVEKMHEDKAIGRKEYRNLKNKLYSDFKEEIEGDSENDSPHKTLEDALSLAASFLFFFAGFLLLTPKLTGFSVVNSLVKLKLNMLGIICFLLSTFFLGVFIRLKGKK